MLAVSALAAVAATGPVWSSKGGRILADGKPVQLKGLNWHGFQSSSAIFHGLTAQPASFFLDLLSNNSFNAVRVPVNLDLMLNDAKHGYVKPEPGTAQSPLMNMTSLEVLDWFVDEFGKRGILTLLDLHCLDSKGTNASPVFFNDAHPVSDTIKGWSVFAQRYASKPGVIGADVFNEPFGATWATGKPTDMDAFAVRAAAAIHEHAPNWLVFVEGSAHSPACKSIIDGDEVGCGYGDNLLGVAKHPVRLAAADKLVYSAHTYGPSQHDRPEFKNSEFPKNMPDVWENHWGYVANLTDAPAVVLGEWGGPTDGQNGLWMDALVGYLTEKELQSNFFWCLNADSNPVGIVIDWKSNPPKIDDAKLAVLSKLTPHPTEFGSLA